LPLYEIAAIQGSGDFDSMKSFIGAVSANNISIIYSGPIETLESHLIVHVAEKARIENRMTIKTGNNK